MRTLSDLRRALAALLVLAGGASPALAEFCRAPTPPVNFGVSNRPTPPPPPICYNQFTKENNCSTAETDRYNEEVEQYNNSYRIYLESRKQFIDRYVEELQEYVAKSSEYANCEIRNINDQ